MNILAGGQRPRGKPKYKKKPTWQTAWKAICHVGLLNNEPPGDTGLSFT